VTRSPFIGRVLCDHTLPARCIRISLQESDSWSASRRRLLASLRLGVDGTRLRTRVQETYTLGTLDYGKIHIVCPCLATGRAGNTSVFLLSDHGHRPNRRLVALNRPGQGIALASPSTGRLTPLVSHAASREPYSPQLRRGRAIHPLYGVFDLSPFGIAPPRTPSGRRCYITRHAVHAHLRNFQTARAPARCYDEGRGQPWFAAISISSQRTLISDRGDHAAMTAAGLQTPRRREHHGPGDPGPRRHD